MDFDENCVKVKKEFRVFCPYYEEWMGFKKELDRKFDEWGTIECLKAQFLLGCLDRSTYTFLQRKCSKMSFTGMSYDELCDILERQYPNDIPVTFPHVERKRFYATSRRCEESPKEWLDRLKEESVTCKFGPSTNSIILDKFVSGINARAFSRISKRDESLSLNEALSFAERFENEEIQVAKPNLVNERHLPYIPPFLQFYFERNLKQANHMSTGIKWDKRIKNDDELEDDWLNCDRGVLRMCRICGKKGKEQSKHRYKSHICFECQPDATYEVGQRNKRTYNLEAIKYLDEIDSIKQITAEEYIRQQRQIPKYVSKYKQIVESVPFVSRTGRKFDDPVRNWVKEPVKSEVKVDDDLEISEVKVVNALKSEGKSTKAVKSEVKAKEALKSEVRVKEGGKSGVKSTEASKEEVKSVDVIKSEAKPTETSNIEVKPTETSNIEVKPTETSNIEIKPTETSNNEVKPTDPSKCEVIADITPKEPAKNDQNWLPTPIIDANDNKIDIKAEEKEEIKEKIQSVAVPPTVE